MNDQRSVSARRSGPLGRVGRFAVALGAALGLATAAAMTAVSPAAAATTQTSSCVDGGGVRWSGKAVWGAPYVDGSGVHRVAIDYAGWTTSRAGVVPTDSWVRSFDGNGTRLQSLAWTGGFDYRSGSTYRARNPLNPPSAPGQAKVTITVGVDGDGHGDCTMTFVQPIVTSTPNPPTPPPTTASDTYEADVLRITNSERTSRSLPALTGQACVDSFAEAQAARMAAEGRMYHQDLGPILTACKLSAVGENVATGYPTGAAVMEGWMNSTGHRANILNARYRLLGVGAVQDSNGRWWAAQVFGA